jgi:hypothetical protein
MRRIKDVARVLMIFLPPIWTTIMMMMMMRRLAKAEAADKMASTRIARREACAGREAGIRERLAG